MGCAPITSSKLRVNILHLSLWEAISKKIKLRFSIREPWRRRANYSLQDQGLADSQIVLISPNDPLAMLKYAQECRELGIAYAYDPSQQIARLSGEDLVASIPGAAYLLCNEYELGMVQKKTGWSLDDIRGEVGVLVNTLGKDGSLIYTDNRVYEIPPVRLVRTVDPTGAGDAYRGGLFAALLSGLPWEVCGRVGALCGAYALEHAGTTSHAFTLAELSDRYAENFGAEPRLLRLGQAA